MKPHHNFSISNSLFTIKSLVGSISEQLDISFEQNQYTRILGVAMSVATYSFTSSKSECNGTMASSPASHDWGLASSAALFLYDGIKFERSRSVQLPNCLRFRMTSSRTLTPNSLKASPSRAFPTTERFPGM